jgi:hypothetical protein
MRIFSTTLRISRLLLLLLPASVFGQQIPLSNWTVPPYRAGTAAQGGLTTMTDVTPGIAFVGIQPCRVADTRGNGAPITGGIFPNSGLRTWDVTGICGIPADVSALSVNFTVVAAAGIPAGSFLLAWPTGQPPPPTAIMTYGPNQVISNAAIVPLGPGEQLNVNVSGSTHVIMDVNGYFTAFYNTGVRFIAATTIAGEAAILGANFSAATGSHAVGGFAGGAGVVHGVEGRAGQSALAGSSGVHGINDSDTAGFGVFGETISMVAGASGVLGRDGTGPASGSGISAGIRGESNFGGGVFGISRSYGVIGQLLGVLSGTPVATGYLGYLDLLGEYAVYAAGHARVTGNLFVGGTISAAMKPFVQPHPYDPSKEIRYVALEGPHSEVYFRGTAQISHGVSRIPIPEDFRLVATADSYSTLVTPVGEMATVAVLSEGDDGIVVQASRNVKIHYVVYAERDAMRNPDPIIENVDFRPEPGADLLAHLPDSYRQLMIQNGTLNADGTVNAKTARRLGWDKEWEKRSGRPALRP